MNLLIEFINLLSYHLHSIAISMISILKIGSSSLIYSHHCLMLYCYLSIDYYEVSRIATMFLSSTIIIESFIIQILSSAHLIYMSDLKMITMFEVLILVNL
jgi:hypothetical protein